MGLFNICEMVNGTATSPPSERSTRSTSTIEAFENLHIEKVNSLKQLLGRAPGRGDIFPLDAQFLQCVHLYYLCNQIFRHYQAAHLLNLFDK